jgi:membrane protease YdiL (CAAX protease family)
VGAVAVGGVEARPDPRRLTWWWVLVGVLALLAYSSRATGGRPPEDALYQWGTAISAVLVYAIVLGFVLLIARGANVRRLLALRQPRSWWVAIGLCLAVLVGILAVGAALDPFLNAGEEQGLTPSGWDSGRAAQFAANALVVAGIAPIVEELTYRGLGFSLLRPYGRAAAIVGVGVAFGLAHGLIEALPILSLFGIGLAIVRDRTDSVYPPILLHAVFNAFALTVSIAV